MAFRSREPERSGNVTVAYGRSRAQTNTNQLLRRVLVQNTRTRAMSFTGPTPIPVDGTGEITEALLRSPAGNPPRPTTPRQRTPASAPATPRGADYQFNTDPRADGHNGTVSVWATASGLPPTATGAVGHPNLQRTRAPTQITPRSPLPELRSRVSSALREPLEVNPPLSNCCSSGRSAVYRTPHTVHPRTCIRGYNSEPRYWASFGSVISGSTGYSTYDTASSSPRGSER
jgi:hypothetical protein